MRNLTHILATAWLILALIVAPFEALAAPLASASGHGDCTMQHEAKAPTDAMHHPMNHAGSEHTGHHCPKCAGQGCDKKSCGDAGCCVSLLQVCVNTVALTVAGPAMRDTCPDCVQHLVSRPPTPLYRPPV